MPIATPEVYNEMFDRAKANGFAFPAINCTSSETINAALRGFAEAESDGIIQFYELTAEGIGRNATELVRKVKAAQHVRKNPGQVCPAHWDEGDDTLAPSIELIGKI